VAACLGYGDSSSDFSGGREIIRREIAVVSRRFLRNQRRGRREKEEWKERETVQCPSG
jgi:hypothetical protein